MGLFSNIVGSLVSDTVSSAFNAHLGRQNARNNAALSRENWAYMQSNAHQMEVNDLRNAGLNPILSATNSQIAGMGSVSGQSGSSDGLGSTVFSALVQKEIAKTNAEIAKTNAETERIKAGIYGNDDSAAKERFTAGTENLKADTSEKNSAKSLNDAQSNYIGVQSKELVRMNDARINQINQDIQNSIETTKALVAKYGAESQAAQAAAAQAYANIKLISENILGRQLDNEQMRRLLENPRSMMDAETWQFVKDSSFWSTFYGAAQYFKALLPFDSVSVGYRKFNSTETKTSNSNHNYNYNRK